MKARLATRLVVSVGVPAAALFAVVLWFSSQRSGRQVVEETESSARATARYHAARLDGRLSEAARVTIMHARALEAALFHTREELESYLRDVVEKTPEIYGSCIAFKPYGFDPELNGYAPYYYRTDKGTEFVQLAAPDYNYFQWDWYREPRDAGHALWTEPYFDEGGGNALMTTFSVPFRKDDVFWGIATIDIAMTQLLAEAARIAVGRTGYAMIISRSGRLLAYPDASKVMSAKLQDSNPRLAALMMAGEDGFFQTKEPLRGEDAWVAFSPVQEGGFSLALVYPKSELLAKAFDLQKEQLALGLIGLLALFGALVFIARSISQPITELAAAAQQVAQGNLEQHLTIDAPIEEVRHLTYAFNKMTRDLQMRMQELRYTTTIKERIEGELNAARNIQRSLVPKKFPPFPERREIDLHAVVKPAREVGGDFYDFYLIEGDWLCFFIGDVSGKGVPAALFMAVTKTLLKASSSKPGAAAQMLAKVNNELCDQTDSGMFVSLLYALLDLRTGALELGNAGHPSPFILGSDGTVTPMDTVRNVALGAIPQLQVDITYAQLAPGDALFLYTDGVTEALSSGGQFYSPARLQIVLRDLATLPADKITRGVVHDVRAFSAEREQSDDISVLAVRWRGPSSATPES
ncbi:MAG: phosphoserine phosphatase RsbU/P [Chthoniobacter sp.]|jgi:sigma-B regulation protein RsbU (phosphoserine phosphatase)|nr:phosphoserine phosphatase RsbU/P [Chthoniobacter sp.]